MILNPYNGQNHEVIWIVTVNVYLVVTIFQILILASTLQGKETILLIGNLLSREANEFH